MPEKPDEHIEKFLKVFIALTFALVAAMLGVVGVAFVKAVLPIFRLTAGTPFELYIQDPLLYLGGPLLCAYFAFRRTMRTSLSGHPLKAAALGVLVGIITTIVLPFAVPLRNYEGIARWLLILAQFPIVPLLFGFSVYRFGAKKAGHTQMSELGFTEPELQRWLLLRSLEWANWPAFVSQPIAPVLFLVTPWYYVLLGVCAADLAWSVVRYRFVSVTLARAAVFLVLLKWPSALICGSYLLVQRSYLAGAFALLWPFVGSFIMLPAKVGQIQLAFAKKIGYVSAGVTL